MYKKFLTPLLLSIFLTSATHASDIITVQGSVEICLTTSIPLTPHNTHVTKVLLKTHLGKPSISEPHTKLCLEVTAIKRSQEYIYPIEFVIDEERGAEKESTNLGFAVKFVQNPQSGTVHYPQEVLSKRLAEESIEKAVALIDGLAPHATKVLKTSLEVRKLLKQTQDDACKVKIENGAQNKDQ